jgi:hypothetical protein
MSHMALARPHGRTAQREAIRIRHTAQGSAVDPATGSP